MTDTVTSPPTARAAWFAWAALGVVYVVWGSTYLAIRFSIETMPPLLSAGSRFVVSGLLLCLAVLVFAGRGGFRMTRAQFATSALVGLLLPGWGNGLVVVAERDVASGLAALLVASIPLYVVVLRRLIGQRPPPVTLVGVAVGFVGLLVLMLGGPVAGAHGSAWYGPWLVLLAALGWACGTVAGSRLPTPPNPVTFSAVGMLVGGAVLTVAGWGTGETVDLAEVSTRSWVGWVYCVLLGALAFSAYVYALGRLPVSTVATYAYVNPVIAVLLGVWLAGERFGPAQLAGGLVVLCAVVLVVRAEHRAGKPPPVPEGCR
ncbi:EamA family transporter [Actinophytocola xinjiangensis]|uniref:EamA family transporter n=1 Tax=Actinophytocola xinjiangensis TaxID=485602 RepID=UPI000AFBF4FE|nr:EamA family transporter [Actinophytocola xinjiangensis]